MGKEKMQAAVYARTGYSKLGTRPSSVHGKAHPRNSKAPETAARRNMAEPVAPQIEFFRFLRSEQRARQGQNHTISVPMLQAMFESWCHPASDAQEPRCTRQMLGGVEAAWISDETARPGKVLLYLSSGGVDIGDLSGCRKLASNLATVLRCAAAVVGCSHSCERPIAAQIKDLVAAYRGLMARGYAAQDITMAGDALGAKAVLSTVLALRDFSLPRPGHVIVMTPWLDAESPVDARTSTQKGGAQLPSAIAYEQVPAVAAVQDVLRASYKGFPRLYINVGAVDGLLDNQLQERARKLQLRAQKAGVDVCLSVVEGMHHAFPFLARQAPETHSELQRLSHWFAAGDAPAASAPAGSVQHFCGTRLGAGEA